MYSGLTCNKCKDKNMQFPGCHTPKTKELVSETYQNQILKTVGAQSRLKQKCKNSLPPSFDTYEDLRYSGQARLSGIYSLSDINNKVSLGEFTNGNKDYIACLLGQNGVNIRVYLEYLEESYINQRIPISVTETKSDSIIKVAESTPIYVPGLESDTQLIRGEILETTISTSNVDDSELTKSIEFDIDEVINKDAVILNNGCLEIYIEISVIPISYLKYDNEK